MSLVQNVQCVWECLLIFQSSLFLPFFIFHLLIPHKTVFSSCSYSVVTYSPNHKRWREKCYTWCTHTHEREKKWERELDIRFKFKDRRDWGFLSTKEEKCHWDHTSRFYFHNHGINVPYWCGNVLRCTSVPIDIFPLISADLHEPVGGEWSDCSKSMQDL